MDELESIFSVIGPYHAQWKEPHKPLSLYQIKKLISVEPDADEMYQKIKEIFKSQNLAGFTKTPTGWEPLYFNKNGLNI